MVFSGKLGVRCINCTSIKHSFRWDQATLYRLLYGVFYLEVKQWKYIKFSSQILLAHQCTSSIQTNEIRMKWATFWREMYGAFFPRISALNPQWFRLAIMARGAKLNEIYDTIIKMSELKTSTTEEMSWPKWGDSFIWLHLYNLWHRVHK